MNMRKQLAVEKMQTKKNIFAAVADCIPVPLSFIAVCNLCIALWHILLSFYKITEIVCAIWLVKNLSFIIPVEPKWHPDYEP